MTATNHALTGALLGLTVANPVLAIPLAFISHFVLDAIPHFGLNDKDSAGKSWFVALLLCEAAACFAIVVLLCLAHPLHWVNAVVCAFIAAVPDFMWIPQFLRARARKPQKEQHHIVLFHHTIQWFQRPIGLVVELVWLLGFGHLLLARL